MYSNFFVGLPNKGGRRVILNRMADTTENITLPQLRWRMVANATDLKSSSVAKSSAEA